jgi:transcriptional regulator with XRE-family HTH domain
MWALYSGGVTLTECVNSWFEATGIKQNVVADRAGMAPTKISEIVNGKNPDPQWSTVEKIARGFGVSLAEFLAGPRPKESGRVERPEGDPLFAALAQGLTELDANTPAEDSWRGDILKAIAVLNRALRRGGAAGEPPAPSAQIRR